MAKFKTHEYRQAVVDALDAGFTASQISKTRPQWDKGAIQSVADSYYASKSKGDPTLKNAPVKLNPKRGFKQPSMLKVVAGGLDEGVRSAGTQLENVGFGLVAPIVRLGNTAFGENQGGKYAPEGSREYAGRPFESAADVAKEVIGLTGADSTMVDDAMAGNFKGAAMKLGATGYTVPKNIIVGSIQAAKEGKTVEAVAPWILLGLMAHGGAASVKNAKVRLAGKGIKATPAAIVADIGKNSVTEHYNKARYPGVVDSTTVAKGVIDKRAKLAGKVRSVNPVEPVPMESPVVAPARQVDGIDVGQGTRTPLQTLAESPYASEEAIKLAEAERAQAPAEPPAMAAETPAQPPAPAVTGEAAPVAAEAAGKQPWEQTQNEYVTSTASPNQLELRNANFRQRANREANPKWQEEEPVGHDSPEWRDWQKKYMGVVYTGQAEAAHAVAVADAIAEGKPVPQSVLNDYPDLQQKQPPPAAGSVEAPPAPEPVAATAPPAVETPTPTPNTEVVAPEQSRGAAKAEVKVLTFDEFSESRSVSPQPPSFPEYHRKAGGVSSQAEKVAANRISTENAKWQASRDSLQEEYNTMVARGEVRKPTRNESLEATARGEGEAAEAARRVLAKQKSPAKAEATPPVVEPKATTTTRFTDAANAARERQAAKRAQQSATDVAKGEAGSFDPQDLADFALIGADHIARGVKDFGAWSKEMAKEGYDFTEAQLRRIYVAARKQHGAAEEPAGSFSPKNASTQVARMMEGLEPDVRPQGKETWQQALDQAAADIASGKRDPRALAESVIGKPRPITTTETMVLAHDGITLKDRLAKLGDNWDKADAKGKDAIEAEMAATRAAFDRNTEALQIAGTDQGRALNIRKALLAENYSLERVLQRQRQKVWAESKAEPSKADIEQAKAEAQKLVDMQAKLDELETANKELQAKQVAPGKRRMPTPKDAEYGANNKLVSKARVAEIEKRLSEKFSHLNAGVDPTVIADLAEMLAYHVEASARWTAGSLRAYIQEQYPGIDDKTFNQAYAKATNEKWLGTAKKNVAKRLQEIAAAERAQKTLPGNVKRTPDVELLTARAKVRGQKARLDDMFGPQPTMSLWDHVTELANVGRTMKTMADLGHMLRQGGMLAVGENKAWRAASMASVKALFSGENAIISQEIRRASPHYDFARASGVWEAPVDIKVSDVGRLQEEFAGAGPLKKVPGLNRMIRAGERSYAEFGNVLRDSTFAKYRELYGDTMTPENYKDLANFLNRATGRGNLVGFEHSARTVSAIFFSPRWFASRIQAPLYALDFRKGADPRVRAIAAKNMAGYIGLQIAFLALQKARGAQVQLDPRSTDFGKAKFGKTRFDVWGGAQSNIRFLAQFVMGESIKGEDTKATKSDRERQAVRFIRGKVAPSIGFAWSAATGKNFIGEDYTPANWKEIAGNELMPLFMNDVMDAWREEGLARAAVVAPATFIGVGVATYAASKSSASPKKLKKLKKQR